MQQRQFELRRRVAFPPWPLRLLRAVCGSDPVRFTSLPSGIDPEDVFNANADFLLGNINSRFDGEHHARIEHCIGVADIMHFKSDVMSQAVNEVLPQRLAVQVLAVRVDVVVGNFVQRIRAASANLCPA